jgi:CRP-like cAMP-binding protein
VEPFTEIAGSVHHFREGTFLFREDELSKGVLCLRKGRTAVIKKDEHGHTRVIGYGRPGELFGISSIMLPTERYTTSIYCLEDCEACLFDTNSFKELLKKEPSLRINAMVLLSQKLNRLEHAPLVHGSLLL